jgi:hypothetical protein
MVQLRSLQNILQAEIDGRCPSYDDVYAWTGEAAVATVYAGDTFAQIILDSSPNATTRSSNTSLITLEQQTMIWTLY